MPQVLAGRDRLVTLPKLVETWYNTGILAVEYEDEGTLSADDRR
jgi:hypothetical protein